jgi:hypothetical protein
MKILFILFVLLFSASSFAGGFTDSVSSFFMSIWEYFTVDIPLFLKTFLIWLLEYIILAKINSMIFFSQVAYSIASTFIDNLSLVSVIQSSIGQLDSDIVQTLIDVRFFDAFTLIMEAFVARYILDFMKW